MLHGLALLLALTAGLDDPGGDARAELDACARRIEELKAQRRAGELARRELERLLVRAQELALQLERTRDDDLQALPAPAQARAAYAEPSPEELRERADAARDEADRLAAEIAELDVKIDDARRVARAGSGGTMSPAVLGGPSMSPAVALRLRELAARRAALVEQRAVAERAAARHEAEARRAEVDR